MMNREESGMIYLESRDPARDHVLRFILGMFTVSSNAEAHILSNFWMFFYSMTQDRDIAATAFQKKTYGC